MCLAYLKASRSGRGRRREKRGWDGAQPAIGLGRRCLEKGTEQKRCLGFRDEPRRCCTLQKPPSHLLQRGVTRQFSEADPRLGGGLGQGRRGKREGGRGAVAHRHSWGSGKGRARARMGREQGPLGDRGSLFLSPLAVADDASNRACKKACKRRQSWALPHRFSGGPERRQLRPSTRNQSSSLGWRTIC